MTNRNLAEVGARLEKAVIDLQGQSLPATPTEKYEQYELFAIQILDSEFEDFNEGILEEYLLAFLHQKRLELGIRDL